MSKVNFVSRLVKEKILNATDAEKLLALPEIELEEKGQPWKGTDGNLSCLLDLPFHNFCVYSDNGEDASIFNIDLTDLDNVTMSSSFTLGDSDLITSVVTCKIDIKEKTFNSFNVNMGTTLEYERAAKIKDDILELIQTSCTIYILNLAALLTYASENRLSPVSKQRTIAICNHQLASKLGLRKRLVRVPNRKVIFLNALPNTGNPTGLTVGTGISKKGHNRRAHRKTLVHERYKNHPYYGIPEAIRIKEVWVGPTSTNYLGNTYTVM